MTISFSRVKEYLDAVGKGAGFAPHGRFWRLSYADFMKEVVPGVTCEKNAAIPIVNTNKLLDSPFFKVLNKPPTKVCPVNVIDQMPFRGPYLTDKAYPPVTLADGSTHTGLEILADIEDWLKAGAPEE